MFKFDDSDKKFNEFQMLSESDLKYQIYLYFKKGKNLTNYSDKKEYNFSKTRKKEWK